MARRKPARSFASEAPVSGEWTGGGSEEFDAVRSEQQQQQQRVAFRQMIGTDPVQIQHQTLRGPALLFIYIYMSSHPQAHTQPTTNGLNGERHPLGMEAGERFGLRQGCRPGASTDKDHCRGFCL